MANPNEARVSTAVTSAQAEWWTPSRRHYVLLILCLVGIFNMVDRQIIAILLEPIKHDLGVSDSAMGFLSGIAFAAFYLTAGIPLARLADSHSRRAVIVGCLAVWSLATAMCGFVHSFAQLAIARIGVAGGEAGAYPASQSMLADLYPAKQRGTVIGIILAAQAIGIAFGLFFGGWLNTAFNWRVAFIIVGTPGILLALLMWLTVSEPPRGMADLHITPDDEAPSVGAVIRFIARSPAMLLLMLVAAGCAFSGYAMLGWAPTFYIRTFGMTTMEAGFLVGVFIASGLFVGNIAAGWIADHFAKGTLSAYAIVGGAGSLFALPFGALFALAPGQNSSLVGLFIANILLTCWLPCAYTIGLGLAPPRMRAMVTAILALFMTLFGIGMGPFFIGVMNDILLPSLGTDAIRWSLLLSLSGLALGGITFLIIALTLRRSEANARV